MKCWGMLLYFLGNGIIQAEHDIISNMTVEKISLLPNLIINFCIFHLTVALREPSLRL